MPSASEELARLKWLIDNGKIQPDEKAKLILPRLDVLTKIENKRKNKRWSIQTTPEDYSELAAINEAYMLTCHQNPSLRTAALLEALKTFDLKGWLESHEG